MNITPSKDHKKPLYAIGVATCILALSVTGCPPRPAYTPTTTVQLAGDTIVNTDDRVETTVTAPLESPANTEFDLRPYKVFDRSIYENTKTLTDMARVKSYAENKLDIVTKNTDLVYEGLYWNYTFTIIGADKFTAWLDLWKYSDRYADEDGAIYISYQNDAAQYERKYLYKDPSEQYLIVTTCRDYKIINEFFTKGKARNGAFPEKYFAFCLEEFENRILSPENALRWAKENHVLVIEDGKSVSGQDMWEAFIINAAAGNESRVLVAWYQSEDKKKDIEATLIFYYLIFNAKNTTEPYYMMSRACDSKKNGESTSFDYADLFTKADPDDPARRTDVYVLSKGRRLVLEETEVLPEGPDIPYSATAFVVKIDKT